jgi:hypothetical protein
MGADDSGFDLAAAREARRKVLFASWGSGKRLTAREEDEIADLIAGGEPSNTVCPPDRADPPGSGTKTGATRSHYAKRLCDYATVFGRSERVIKGWIQTGRENANGEDLPPLDNPPMMLRWWQRNKSNKPPDVFLKFAREGGEGEGGAPAKPERKTRPASEVIVPQGSGYAAELDRLRLRAQLRAGELDAAEEGGDMLLIDEATRRYERALELLRQYERDATKILADQGDLLPRQETEALVRDKQTALRQRLRTLYRGIDAELLSKASVDERDAVFQSALDLAFEQLALRGFSSSDQPFQLAA